MMFLPTAYFLVALLPGVVAVTNHNDNDQPLYSFDDFVQDYGKVYSSEKERATRKEIFQANLNLIRSNNDNNNNGKYSLQVNEYADRRIPQELPLGLHKKMVSSADHVVLATSTKKQSTEAAEVFYQNWLHHSVKPVSELPDQVDWRTHQNPTIITPVKNQGFCGSCWAFASTAVLESHIALQTKQLYTLSPQELVSCVTNPQHCGGAGGCAGATYELAFDHVVQHGMVPEQEFPYKSDKGAKVQCSIENTTSHLDVVEQQWLRGTSNDKDNKEVTYIHGAVATINGYVNFPTNNYTILLNAVATLGPIGVTVAASSWAFYSSGVFEFKDHNSSLATSVNHAVVLEGYGIDTETQVPYWLVRNSWGPNWGEDGYIRLKRVDPSTLVDFDKQDCGMDLNPADGAACTKDENGNPIVPKPVKVCGTSAILYDTFVPIGGRLITNKKQTMTGSVLVA